MGHSLSHDEPKDIIGNEDGAGNRRVGTLTFGNFNQYDHANTQAGTGDSNIFANGFPKYFVPKLQVIHIA